VWRFAAEMPPAKTERGLIAEDLQKRLRATRTRDGRAKTPRS
jgi:hypothetical protein